MWHTVQMFEYLGKVTIKSVTEYLGDVTIISVIEYLGDVTIKSVTEYLRDVTIKSVNEYLGGITIKSVIQEVKKRSSSRVLAAVRYIIMYLSVSCLENPNIMLGL